MVKKPEKLESTLVGVAGEYLVAGELTLRGFIASITLRNSRGIDIIASNANGSSSVSIQVKTNSNGKQHWILNKKAEAFHSENHYYIFVALQDLGQRPQFYIVPSKVVAEYTYTSHSEWLKGEKRDGSARKDSSIRKFRDFENEYLEAWDLIQL
ncbi:MAG: aspartate ammonia-lyase [Chloroflexi bacterium]|nr:aspartate ammonia-lyase [Chloroflexota bacterium]